MEGTGVKAFILVLFGGRAGCAVNIGGGVQLIMIEITRRNNKKVPRTESPHCKNSSVLKIFNHKIYHVRQAVMIPLFYTGAETGSTADDPFGPS
jgi:hypothetical protein